MGEPASALGAKGFEARDSSKLNSSLILAIAARRYIAIVVMVVTFSRRLQNSPTEFALVPQRRRL